MATRNCCRYRLVYLAGAMENTTDNGINWRVAYRDDLQDILDIHAIIPGIGENLVKPINIDMQEIKVTNPTLFEEVERRFIALDIALIEISDFVIVRYEGEAISGTTAEVHHCYMTGKPVYMVTSLPFEQLPGWMASEIGVENIFQTLSCLIGHLGEKIYNNV